MLITPDGRSLRGLPQPTAPDRDDDPNPNVPGPDVHVDPGPPPAPFSPISVGPNSSAGFGNTHVMYPAGTPGAQAWSGWPVGWDAGWSNGGNSGLMGKYGAATDVIYAAIDLNASILSTMPPYIVKGAIPQADMPWLENPEPEVYPSWTAFAKEAFWCLESVGEVFLYATAKYAEDDRPRRFMMLNPAFVNVEADGEGGAMYSVAGTPVDRDDILHIKYASWPGDLHGHGPLEVAGARVLAVAALTKYGSNLAQGGGLPPAVLRHPKRLSRQQMGQMQSDWVEARMSGMGLPAVLSDGTELDVLNPQIKDVTLAELQKFSEARLAVLLGVPPTLLGLPSGDSATYTNSTNMFDFHWRASLRPKAQMVMKALSGWLLPGGQGVELNRDEYIRPGLMERSQAYAMLIGAGVLSAGEVRLMERYAGDAPTPEEDLTGASSAGALGGGAGGFDPSAVQQAGGTFFGSPGRPTKTNTSPGGQQA